MNARGLRALRTVRLLVVSALVSVPAGVAGQTLTTSLLMGEVVDTTGAPVAGARVAVENVRTGISYSVQTEQDGRFRFRLLDPGTYDVLAERIDYRPQMLTGLRLQAGRAREVSLVIAQADPPVMTIDSVVVPTGVVAWSRAGTGRWFGDLEIDAPRPYRSDLALMQLATSTDGGSVEGLPPHLSRDVIDGFAFTPVAPTGTRGTSPRPLSALRSAELISQVPDVTWAGSAGAQLRTESRRGTRDFALRTWGAGADPDFALGRFTEDVAGPFDLSYGGLEVSGPIIPDTAVFVLGGEWRVRARAHPRAWRIDDVMGARVGAMARDRLGLTLQPLTLPYVEERDEVAAWGRFDWRITDGHDLASFVDFSLVRAPDDVLASRATPFTSGSPEAMDALAGVSLRSVLTPRFANELRVAAIRSSRTVSLPGGIELRALADEGIPSTTTLDGALIFGADPRAPWSIERTGVQLEQALLVALGNHALKVGLVADWESREHEGAFGRTGLFTFGGGSQFETSTGAFFQSVGAPPAASFWTLETGAFLQDTWRPAPGLELVGGLRIVRERVPDGDIDRNMEWERLTGVRNDSIDTRISKVEPRFGFVWNVRQRDQWLVRGNFGVHHDDLSRGLIAETMIHDGGVRVRRGFGDLGAWPAAPDSTAAPVRGPSLSILPGEIQAPRTTRASFGISRIGRTSVHVSTAFRQTDFLPSRRDINRITSPWGHDQYGRAVFGDLRQQGALLGVVPGSNRRFDSFDVVSAIEPTASSEYWDVSMLVERRIADVLRFSVSYTYSTTHDDFLAYSALDPTLAFEPQLGDTPGQTDWAEGVSDFDVPHRFTLAGELSLPLPLRPTVGVVYRARSAPPFTPRFQPGVDVNGDYAANDPAFVDEGIAGMEAVLSEWDCLRDQVGDFAERNSCRGESLQFLDARFSVDVGFGGAAHARIHFDALNLLEGVLAPRDPALYLVDPDAELVSNDATRTVTIPLRVNPNFGRPVRAFESGRVFRAGIEVSF